MATPRFGVINDTGDEWDYTSYVDWKSYSVNQEDIVTTWTDANYKDHESVARTRISGTVTVGFSIEGRLTAFLGVLSRARAQDGTNMLTLYVENIDGIVYTRPFFVKKIGEIRYDFRNGRRWQTVSLEIKEP